MNEFRIIVLTPPGLPDPSIAIAACRAGAIGVLDLEYTREEGIATERLEELARFARNEFGVKRDGPGIRSLLRDVSANPEDLRWVILADPDVWARKDEIGRLRSMGIRVLLECTSLNEARTAEQIGVDGVIAKGNEAGGRVAQESTFVLLQQFLNHLSVPVWAQGGIGLHTASACCAAGAGGVVLDSQLLLTRESPLPESIRGRITAMDGSESLCLGSETGSCYRACSRLGVRVVGALQETEKKLAREDADPRETRRSWREAVARRVGCSSAEEHLFLLGQDVALASSLADLYVTVGGIVAALQHAIPSHYRTAAGLRPLAEDSPLAESHGTRYPIVQGPMARITDLPRFALHVSREGGLPFLAVGWTVGQDLEDLLEEMQGATAGCPWGVGLLGFLPPGLYQQQLGAVIRHKPPFALIAGGRPDQAKSLEEQGIPAYVHVPSPGLLNMSIAGGVKRFIFEGREAGGHVGPRSSFILWEQMIDALAESLPSHGSGEEYHVLFAGGIHDALSASMVAVMAAPLLQRGVRIGLQMGTAYLFTEEAVSTGAIVEDYQLEAIRCDRTVLLEPGPGHTYRCLDTPFATAFEEEKKRLAAEGTSNGKMQEALEKMSIGKLRIAAKGVERDPAASKDGQAPTFVKLDDEARRAQGMYLIGQLAALRNRAISVQALHQDVCVEGSKRLEEIASGHRASPSPADRSETPSEIAIVGMACILPKAPGLQTYWENILNKVNAIREVPRERWDARLYFESDRKSRDKVYSKWGAFLDDVPFDPLKYGMPPNSIHSIEPLQLLTLEVASKALEDAGYAKRPFPRERTSVILGISGSGELGQTYAFRSSLPKYFGNGADDITAHFEGTLPEWTEDSFPGILMNVAAGRIANRFDLGGANFTVDGACASSLAAVYLAVKELESGSSDMVIVGGADTMQNPFTYFCFSKTQAFSPSGKSRPLDKAADGIVIGEGVAVAIFKRLADAERDGDRIYAVIKGIGAGSDGRDKSLTAPRSHGQTRVLERAYRKAGFSPKTVSLMEAHATGTEVGDQVETEALCRVMKTNRAAPQGCAIGSVKSMIGHTKSTAGIASLIKTAMSLHHKVLPPTFGVETPAASIRPSDSPLYVNIEARPWFHDHQSHPRRGGVSAFGFGGTNFHVALEEYTGDFLDRSDRFTRSTSRRRSTELFLWEAGSRDGLVELLQPLEEAVARGAAPDLDSLAQSVNRAFCKQAGGGVGPSSRLALVAGSLEELSRKLKRAREALCAPGGSLWDPQGIYFTEQSLSEQGKLAFLFPGQGSQYPDMLSDLAVAHPAVRALFERSDRLLGDKLTKRLSEFVSPAPSFTEEDRVAKQKALAQTFVAQPALGTAGLALLHMLGDLGVQPEMVAGHSYGEYLALCAAGVMNERDLILVSEARGRFMAGGNGGSDLGTMAAVGAGLERVSGIVSDMKEIWIANRNAPEQTVISGTRPAIELASKRFREEGIQSRLIPVACGFHSPLVSQACRQLKEFLSNLDFQAPRCPVYSNTTGKPYPERPEAVAERLSSHLRSPVEFVQEIETMYEDGARIFVEVGPGRVLTGLVGQILGDRPHLASCSNQKGRSGFDQLHHLIGQLAVHGVPVQVERLYEGRQIPRIDHESLKKQDPYAGLPPTTWLLNGTRAKPLKDTAASDADRTIPPMPLGAPQTNPAGKAVGSAEQARTPDRPVARAVGQPRDDMARAFREAPSSGEKGVTETISRFQHLMDRFLETQRDVMLAYLGKPSDRPERSTQSDRDAHRPPEFTGVHVRREPQIVPVIEEPDERPHAPPLAASAVREETADEPVGRTDLQEEDGRPHGDLQTQLLKLVSERTGYPEEMLGLDLDLEADLGIDSIKRIEILGSFMRTAASSCWTEIESEMDGLTALRTLRDINQWIAERLGPETKSETRPEEKPEEPSEKPPSIPSAPVQGADQESLGNGTIPRFLVSPRAISAESTNGLLPFPGVLLVTDDEGGVARALLPLLEKKGQAVALVKARSRLEDSGNGSYGASLDDPQGVSDLLDLIRERQGRVVGLLHLAPLRNGNPVGSDLTLWRDHLRGQVKSLFYLIREMGRHRGEQPEEGLRCVLAATGMGGSFASDPERTAEDFFPGHGGIVGLLKCLAIERPTAIVKAVDLCPKEQVADHAAHLLKEMTAHDHRVEVGYAGSQRLTLEPTLAVPERGEAARVNMGPSSVILVTGGARGITADVAMELANRYQPEMILVGRSPLPAQEESADTAALDTPKEIKAALIERMRKQGESVEVSRVEKTYNRLLGEREIRRNLQAMKRAGSRVRYVQADVRDPEAFGRAIDEIYASCGRIDGVLHGAGVIEDKLIQEKTPSSFDRVFDTKVDSAFLLSRKLRSDSLRFLVFFSSVAGRFGNKGQGDYAAANEVLNKLAVRLDREWPGRVVSINWGPWDKTGMVSPELKKQFAQRGIPLISREEGPKKLCEELLFGRKGEVEVVLGGFDGWATAPTRRPKDQVKAFPMVDNGRRATPTNSLRAEKARILDPSKDLFLDDHRLHGKPVLPAAFAMELMAEVVTQQWPDMEVSRFEDIAVLRGLVLKNGPEAIRVEAEEVSPSSNGSQKRILRARITDTTDQRRPYYQATVEMSRTLAEPSPFDPAVPSALRPFPTSIEEAYGRWLFHGPTLQCISKIEGISEEGIIATVAPSTPEACLSDSPEGEWIIDPVVVDSGFQLAILWARIQHDFTPLPSRFPVYHRYGSLSGAGLRCHLRTFADPSSLVMRTDLYFVDASGNVLGMFEQAESTCSKALNEAIGIPWEEAPKVSQ